MKTRLGAAAAATFGVLLATALAGGPAGCGAGTDAAGGATTGGGSSGGSATGGHATGGNATGGHATGGNATGGSATGGSGGGDGGAPPPTCAPAPSSPLVVDAKDAAYGALGDGTSDDTAALQKAIDAVAGTGGTLLIPAGTYMVDAVTHLRLGSDMTLRLAPGAVLQAISNDAPGYATLHVSGVANANIVGGSLRGDLATHTVLDPESPGEAGMGVNIVGSHHVVVEGVTSAENWGDGFYVGEGSSDVTLCNLVARHNRRQGMSVTSVDGLVVKGSSFADTTRYFDEGEYWCGAGIDIEPNLGETVNDVLISGCTFSGNAGPGVASGPSYANTGKAFVTHVVVDGNVFTGNGSDPACGAGGLWISNSTGYQLTQNVVKDNIGIGIYLAPAANDNTVTGNTVTGTLANAPQDVIGDGIQLYQTSGNTVTGNTVTDNAGHGIRDAYPVGANDISGNTVSGNGLP
jgi:parallel beta-helix repeat protein